MSKLKYSDKTRQISKARRDVVRTVNDNSHLGRGDLTKLANEFLALKKGGGVTKAEARKQRDDLKAKHKAEHAMRMQKAEATRKAEALKRKAAQLAGK